MLEIPVGVSNHHVHLKKEDIDILFGKDYKLTKKRDLSQKTEFACNETVTLKKGNVAIENVRIIGPERKYTQVEVLQTDAYLLNINPPIRSSGDLENAENITIIGPNGSIESKNSCIIAERHIHINNGLYPTLKDGSIVTLKTKNNQVIENVHIKKGPHFTLELHIDKDDSKKFNLDNGDIVILE